MSKDMRRFFMGGPGRMWMDFRTAGVAGFRESALLAFRGIVELLESAFKSMAWNLAVYLLVLARSLQ